MSYNRKTTKCFDTIITTLSFLVRCTAEHDCGLVTTRTNTCAEPHLKNMKSEPGAQLLRVVGICVGEVGEAVPDLSRALSPY